jgi:hypothetical protein
MSNKYFDHLDDKEIFAFGDLHGDIHALRLLLDLTESIDPPELGWDKLYEKVFAETDLHLNDLRSKSLYNIFNDFKDEIKKFFPKWKDGMEDKVIVVTGDMIDNLRGKYTKLDDSETCHIGFVKQEELKIVLCLKILDYQAIQADRGCRVITLLGNHEDMNIKNINSDYFCQDDQYYKLNDTTYVTRKKFFKKYHAIFNFEDKEKKIIFRINNNIFMHGGMTSDILDIYKNSYKYKNTSPLQMNTFVTNMNGHYNLNNGTYYNENYNNEKDILWNRNFGEPEDKETSTVCDEFNEMIEKFIDGKFFNLIVGHCIQSYEKTQKYYINYFKLNFNNLTYEDITKDHKKRKLFKRFVLSYYNNILNIPKGDIKDDITLENYLDLFRNFSSSDVIKNKNFLRYFHNKTKRTKDKHVMSGTTEEKNILDSYDSILDNPTIEFPSFIGINTTKCGLTDRIFRLDVGMSKAFDDVFYEEFKKLYNTVLPIIGLDNRKPIKHDDFIDLFWDKVNDLFRYIKNQFFLLIKYVLSRAPQLLHITITGKTEVFRASLTNTLKYMSRDNSKLIPSDNNKKILFLKTVAYIDQAEISFNEFG